MIKPLFVFSLPRSGSTLVQRVLATGPQIATTSEPWVLLPLLYASKQGGQFSEYDTRLYNRAMEDFCAALRGGPEGYREELRRFVLRLYRRASGPHARYFLDKTPRYSLISRQIIDTFPEAKFVFLWRNPLSVAASMVDTWGQGRWLLYLYKVDLYKGLASLIDAYQHSGGRATAIRYEQLVRDPEDCTRLLFDYLGVPHGTTAMESFGRVNLEGRMGDPTGVTAYENITAQPLDKWRDVFCNPLRKRWARRYLHWIGTERLAIMGYDLDSLLNQLDDAPNSLRHVASDAWLMSRGVLHPWVEPTLFRRKRSYGASPENIVAHG